MLIAVAALLLAAGAPVPSGGPTEQQVLFDPVYAYLTLKPGAEAEQVFKIKNPAKRAVVVELFRRDAWHGEGSVRTFPEPGTSPQSVSKWVTPGLSGRVRIGPGETILVTEKIKVPLGVSSATYLGALMVRFTGREKEGGEVESAEKIVAGVRTNSVVALTLHVLVPPADGTIPAPAVTATNRSVVLPSESSPLTVAMKLANRSVFEVRPTGTLAIFDSIGRPVGKAAFDALVLWPGQELWAQCKFDTALPPGAYHAQAAFVMQDPGNQVVTFGTAPVQQRIDFEVKASEPLLRNVAPPPGPAAPSGSTKKK